MKQGKQIRLNLAEAIVVDAALKSLINRIRDLISQDFCDGDFAETLEVAQAIVARLQPKMEAMRQARESEA